MGLRICQNKRERNHCHFQKRSYSPLTFKGCHLAGTERERERERKRKRERERERERERGGGGGKQFSELQNSIY